MNAILQRALTETARWSVRHPRWAIVLVLVYFFSPIDIIPEALVGPLGYLDDFLMMLLPLVLRSYARRRFIPHSEETK